MATGRTKVQSADHRLLGVRTWLGVGAVTVGVGAALAASSAIAQADTGDQHSASARSASKHDATPSAGPTKGSGVGSGVVAGAAGSVPASVSTKAPAAAGLRTSPTPKRVAAATRTASKVVSTSKSFDTPFGPITVDVTTDIPDAGGPLSISGQATTPLGKAKVALTGQHTLTTSPSIKSEIAVTGGTLEVPAPIAFLVSAVGSVVTGGLAVYDNATAFVTALQSGHLLSAAKSFFSAAPGFLGAVLFGQRDVTVPLQLGLGPAAILSIPFGGLFAPLKPVTLSYAGYSFLDEQSGAEVKIDPVDVEFAGTQFGGAGRAFLKLFGI